LPTKLAGIVTLGDILAVGVLVSSTTSDAVPFVLIWFMVKVHPVSAITNIAKIGICFTV
jgi:hypothetical protein